MTEPIGRAAHVFSYPASQIAAAASREAMYHEGRVAHWTEVLTAAQETVRTTAKLKFDEIQQTDGKRLTVIIDYGDPAAYVRMQTSYDKAAAHRVQAERLRSDATMYASQDQRLYELSAADVAHFRIGQPDREPEA